MNGVSKRLIAAVAAIFLGIASFQAPPAAAAAPGGQQAGTTAPTAAPAARLRQAVNAPLNEVAGEVIRVLTADGFKLVRRKPNALVFQRPADAALARQVLGSDSGDAAMRVVVKLKEKAKSTRIVARMMLVTGPGPGRKPKTRVTDAQIVQGLEEALRTVKTAAES